MLSRLQHVRRTGPGRWTACCPCHESKSKSSLSIRETDDGAILLHDFGGCSVVEITSALGIEVSELFSPRLPENKQSHRPRRPRLSLADVSEVVTHELTLITIIVNDVRSRGASLMTEGENSIFTAAVNRLQAIITEARSL